MTLCARHVTSGVFAEDVHPATNDRAGVTSRHRAMVRARILVTRHRPIRITRGEFQGCLSIISALGFLAGLVTQEI